MFVQWLVKHGVRLALLAAVLVVMIAAIPSGDQSYGICDNCTIYPYPIQHPPIPPIHFGLTPTP